MRIIVVNKYYYLDGGPERYLFNLMDYLTTLGHEVIPFSVDYAQNRPSEYSKYFMKPAAGAVATKLSQMEGGLSMKLKLAARSIYSYEAKGGLDRLIRCGYELLGLITYFTAGKKEVRAWTITRGTKAPQAAGVIHSDFEKGFIRAEVIAYEDFVAAGGEAGAKGKGLMRLEGKEYVVQDGGDVMHFRFNV